MGKSFLASKTNWGVILMLIPVLSKSMLGVDIDQALLDDTANYLALVMQLGGGALAIYGRWKAKLPLSWKLPDLAAIFKGPTLGLLLAVAVVLASGNLLVACTTTAPGSGGATAAAKQSAAIALTVYVKGYQPALLAYARLPGCERSSPPCLDIKLYTRMYAADGTATSCIAAVQPILQSALPDFNVVSDCLQKIEDAKRIFAEAGVHPIADNVN